MRARAVARRVTSSRWPTADRLGGQGDGIPLEGDEQAASPAAFAAAAPASQACAAGRAGPRAVRPPRPGGTSCSRIRAAPAAPGGACAAVRLPGRWRADAGWPGQLAAWLVVGGAWQGPVSPRKPATFGASFGLTTITLAWVTGRLRASGRTRWLMLSPLAAVQAMAGPQNIRSGSVQSAQLAARLTTISAALRAFSLTSLVTHRDAEIVAWTF